MHILKSLETKKYVTRFFFLRQNGHNVREWQKKGYIQEEALQSMFLLNLDKKLECANMIIRQQGTSSEAMFLAPFLNTHLQIC